MHRFLRGLIICLVSAVAIVAQIPRAAWAQADDDSVRSAIADILSSSSRLPLPHERVRATLNAHYVRNKGIIYWANTGRMTPFLQRIGRANYDGLNPQDYPLEPLTELRDGLDPDDADAAAKAELY